MGTLSDAMSDIRGLNDLRCKVVEDLEIIAYPKAAWVPARADAEGERLLDVLVIGGGQGGLAVAFALTRERITRFRIVDMAERGLEGPWNTYARMETLRSPKDVNGPDLDIPSLTFQAWFEAQWGATAWDRLGKIPKGQWADYLLWFRDTVSIPVENRVEAVAIEPQEDGTLEVRLRHLDDGREETVGTRKLVLATGIESTGRWSAPSVVEALPRRLWSHTGDDIDFRQLAGKRVAVLGAGASAMDNAATALEAGAKDVTVFVRRPEIQRIQPFKWLSFPGFLKHFGALDDAMRWRFMNHLLSLREAFPRETWERVSRHKGFQLITGAPWDAVSVVGNGAGEMVLAIDTPKGRHTADHIIAGTGFEMDIDRVPLLAPFRDSIARWEDRYTPPEDQRNPRLSAYPYLGDTFQFLERTPGSAPHLRHIRLFTFGTTMSFGPSGSSINAMKFAVPRLVSGIVRDLFVEDAETHFQSLVAYDLPEFLLPGEEGDTAPTVPVIDRPDAAE